MQLGNVWLKMNQFGSNILKKDVTPAECVILSHPAKDGVGFAASSGGNPLSGLEVTGEAKKMTFDTEDMVLLPGRWVLAENDEGKTVKVFEGEKENRTDLEEKSRLSRVYTEKVVEALFPGAMPVLPQKFTDIECFKTKVEATPTPVTPVLNPTATKKVAEPLKK